VQIDFETALQAAAALFEEMLSQLSATSAA